jgi:hypothetical protein
MSNQRDRDRRFEENRRRRQRERDAKENARKAEFNALFDRAAANTDKPGPVRFGDPVANVPEVNPFTRKYHRYLRRQ